jgi:hypothetical protein
MQNLITPGVLSFGLLLIGALLFLFSAGNVDIRQIKILIDEKTRRLVRVMGIVLILIGLVGVIREIFFNSPQNVSVPPTAISISTSALLPLAQPDTQQPSTNNPTATLVSNIFTTTQTATEQPQVVADCLPTDYIPSMTGYHPPIDTLICIPSGVITWISSDAAQFSIPSIGYNKTFSVGYTFVLFGPVKFTISSVQSKFVWMDSRTDTSLVNNLGEKTLNLIYQDGKVCDLALYTGAACP